jgi:uncharacterized protein (TIGR00251 family)
MSNDDLKESARIINVSVTPAASKSEVAGVMEDGTLKVRVTAPPERGKANEHVREVLAAHFSVPKSCIEVVRGATSRRKQIRIADIPPRLSRIRQ